MIPGHFFLIRNGDFFCINIAAILLMNFSHLYIKINISEAFLKNIKETFRRCLVPTGWGVYLYA